MKNLLYIFLICFSTIPVIGHAQDPSNAVVEIKYGAQTVGFGFLWPDKDHVVTALHVVAGRNKSKFQVRSFAPGNKGYYPVIEVEKVLKEADLALLKIKTPIDVDPMEISYEEPKAGRVYTMYRTAPAGGVILDSQKKLENGIHPLSIYIGPEKKDLYKALVDQGYPQITAKIARVSTTIQKGDSGSPICDDQGKLVGIIDGGLGKGLRTYNWAIIASKHLNELNDEGNNESFASVKKKDPSIYLVTEDVEKVKSLNIPKGNSSLDLIFTTTVENIDNTIELSYEEDIALKKFYRDVYSNTSKYVINAKIDVYEDSYTGATIAIPAGLNLSYSEAESGYVFVEAVSPSGNVKMVFTIVADLYDPNDDFSNSMINYLLDHVNDAQWHQNNSDFYADEFVDYYHYDYNYVSNYNDEIDISLMYNHTDFMAMGTFIYSVNDIPEETIKEDEYYFALLRRCIMFSDFPAY